MSKATVSAGQARSLIGSFTLDTPWDEIQTDLQPFIELTPAERGKCFAAFLKNRCQMIIGEPKIIPIDRTEPFNPATFIGAGWSIWKGPANGDGLSGDEDQDVRSLALTELDVTSIRLETMLKSGEKVVGGEEKQKRLKEAGHVRLDAGIFQHFWQNKHLIPDRFKLPTNGNTTYIYFDGTVLRNPSGYRCVLCLCWGGGEWGRHYYYLDFGWDAYDPSAVLASQN